MGLSNALARYAVNHAHVLLVEVPGHWLTRAAAEQHLRARGWRFASSPADADVLALCGTPGPEIAAIAARLWEQLPGPRARVQIDAPHLAAAAFESAATKLLDRSLQRDDSQGRSAKPDGEQHRDNKLEGRDGGHDHGGHGSHVGKGEMDDGGHAEHSAMDHGESSGHGDSGDHGGMGHGMDMGHAGMGHGAMSHGGMDMAPAGIPLAHGGEDRDGLELDVLHLRLGPVLPSWPTGLVLRCSLQGDLIVHAEVTLVDAHHAGVRCAHHRAARRCDNAAGLLALAGWEDAAGGARRLRDRLLNDGDRGTTARDLDRLHRRIKRSWLLRWSLRGVGYLSAADVARLDLPGHLRGDTHDRLLSMIQRAADDIAGADGGSSDASEHVPIVKIGDVVQGLDIATARLVVASLDLDPLPAASAVAHA
ncbi:hypothetical protein [Micromonospora sp. WMMC250]|uniref:hypothetical protein n=1 Tax=Micromonospora sp. WMMC250 TaxID=3014781 RepID=UPI0022B709A7|nr:hypothetical protein [Micromonospora sp. WMMC250]MCZ7379825.1 hypothetical protein [Micromonospora sp. WMMC250]